MHELVLRKKTVGHDLMSPAFIRFVQFPFFLLSPADCLCLHCTQNACMILYALILMYSANKKSFFFVVRRNCETMQRIRRLNPRAVTMLEWDCDLLQPMFMPRFEAAIDFFYPFFQSHEQLGDRFSFGRQSIEERVVSRELCNVVACEGLNRVVRSESFKRLTQRMLRLGFCPITYDMRSKNDIQALGSMWSSDFRVEYDQTGGARLLHSDSSLTSASAWMV